MPSLQDQDSLDRIELSRATNTVEKKKHKVIKAPRRETQARKRRMSGTEELRPHGQGNSIEDHKRRKAESSTVEKQEVVP